MTKEYCYYALQPYENARDITAHTIVGDCQEPSISDGDVVITNIALKPVPGNTVIYKNSCWCYHTDTEGVLLTNNYGELRPDNPNIYGVVIAVIKRQW